MFSSLVQLAGFGLVSYGVGLEAGTGWGVITGGLAVVFVGHFLDDLEVARNFRRVGGRLRTLWRSLGDKEGLLTQVPSPRSPHPPIVIDPETEAMARRLAEQRLRRGDGKTYDGIRQPV